MKTKDFLIELANKMPDEDINKITLSITCGKFMIDVKKFNELPASISITSMEEL